MYLYGIAGLAFAALTVVAGWSAIGRLRLGLTTLEALAASTIVGVVGATWAGVLAYLATGRIEGGILSAALAMLAVIAITRPWKAKPSIDRAHLPVLAIILAISFLFMYVCLLGYFDGEYHVAYPLYGDAAFHSAMVSSFASGVNYPPQYPIMAGQPLRYTFLIDFYSAMLDKLGLGLQWSIVLPGTLLLASLLALLYFFGVRFTGRRAGGLLATALIVFSGGFGFVYACADWLASGSTLPDFLAGHYLNYTTFYDLGLVFTNFIDVVLAERTALTGFAVGTLIMLLFYVLLVAKKAAARDDRALLLSAGVLAGLLPMFHTYTYVCVMIAAALFFLMSLRGWVSFSDGSVVQGRDSRLAAQELVKDWLYFFLPAVLLALPQMAWMLGGIGDSFLRVRIGWMANSLADIPAFWIRNMGVELLLLAAGCLAIGRERLKFYLPFAAIFLVANVLVFQPWDYDNHSFFSFWLLASVPLMAAALLYVWDLRSGLGRPLAAALLVLAVLTGTMVADFMLSRTYVEFSQDSVHVADWIAQNTPPDAVFLTGDAHNHPVTCLAGRKSFLGYYPWMWSHGVKTDDRFYAVAGMYNATSPTDLYGRMAQNDIGYVYLGPEELSSGTYAINRTLFDSLTPIFDWISPSGGHYRIFAPAPS